MSDDDLTSPSSRSNFEIDLALSFQPAWVRETSAPEKISRLAEKFDSRPERSDHGRGDGKGRRQERRPGRGRPDRRDSPPAPRMTPSLRGWNVQFLPEPRGVDGLARQIKAATVTYPLFDLAQLVLEKPERFLVKLSRTDGPPLFQLRVDGSLWLSQHDAVAGALEFHLDQFYRRERVSVDPPKGSHLFVALCGLSDTLLGPPNHHDYQEKIRKVHAARFSHMPFDAYKSRIRMVKDEETIQKWKDEQSARDVFFPLGVPEGTEAPRLESLAEVTRHFRDNYATGAIMALHEAATLPGAAVLRGSAQSVQMLVGQALEELRRFPLPLAQTLGRALAQKGLQVFKAHQNITFISAVRPRILNRTTTPVGEGIALILDYLETHPRASRAQCRQSLAGRSAEDGDVAVARDLAWLLQEGYVVDYARRGLEAMRRPNCPAARSLPKPPPTMQT